MNMAVPNYDPSVFLNVENAEQAVEIILSPDGGLTSQQRWQDETSFVMDILKRHIKPQSFVLDYGCGIGRMAKPLIESLQCKVRGVDISERMLDMAVDYVASDRFSTAFPDKLDAFRTFDAALAIWSLQHVEELELEIVRIRNSLKIGGILFLLNNYQRAVPIAGQWIDDGKDVDNGLLAVGFDCVERGKISGGEWLEVNTFWAVYRNV